MAKSKKKLTERIDELVEELVDVWNTAVDAFRPQPVPVPVPAPSYPPRRR